MNNDVLEYIKYQIDTLEIFMALNDNISHVKQIAEKFNQCEKVIVIGTGGSSLGGKCLVNFEAYYNGREPRVIFMENTDSRHFMNIINRCNPDTTGIIVISKSGKTTETLVLFLTLCELWKDFDFKNRAIAITELSDNNDLRNLAESKHMQILRHNPKIGGRFSVFSIVGLLPAIIEGVDADLFISGAKKIVQEIVNLNTIAESKLLVDIVTMYNIFKWKKVDQYVMMLYSDFLIDYGKWFVQLIAESLGKEEEFGITPILAVGTVDQHSLLQLFLGGPANKLFTVVIQKNNLQTPQITDSTNSKMINYLRNRTIHELMLANQEMTIEALRKKALVRVMEFETFSIETLGCLMMSSVIEVLVLAKLAGINPFDQPAVDSSKELLFSKLSDINYTPIRHSCEI